MKKTLLLAIALVLVFGAANGVLAAGKVFKVGADATFPPFEFADDKTKEYKGFDVDLAYALADKMGMKAEIVNTAWDGIIPGLMNGNYDAIMSAMTITSERKQAVDFSDQYFEAGQTVVVKKSDKSIKTKNDLKGKIVAVQLGTTGDFAATAMKNIKKVSRFNSAPEALQEVLNGAANCAVVDEMVAQEFIKANPGKAKVAVKKFTSEFYGIAIKKGNKAMLTNVNKALAALKKDGTYQKLYKKWFANL